MLRCKLIVGHAFGILIIYGKFPCHYKEYPAYFILHLDKLSDEYPLCQNVFNYFVQFYRHMMRDYHFVLHPICLCLGIYELINTHTQETNH